MTLYVVLLIASIALLYKVISLFERASHNRDSEELRKHVIRMEGRR
jgi:hypothetical protein